MKRLIIIPKNKEKGSVTLFVLIGCIFVLMILLLVNVGLINNKANHEKQIDEISKIYSVNENDLEQAYQTVSANTKNYISKDEVEELIQQKTDGLNKQIESLMSESESLKSKISELTNNKLNISDIQSGYFKDKKYGDVITISQPVKTKSIVFICPSYNTGTTMYCTYNALAIAQGSTSFSLLAFDVVNVTTSKSKTLARILFYSTTN